MSIASRISSMEEHLEESYQELEGIGIDTTVVNNNLENIPKLLDGYWETLPKVTGEGTSITLDNTKEGKMKVLLKGNTYQDSTTGKNLYNDNFDDYTQPVNYRICPITLTQGQTYVLKGNKIGTNITGVVAAVVPYGEQYTDFSSQLKMAVDSQGYGHTLTFTPDSTWTSPKLAIYASDKTTFDNLFTNYEIQLEKGSAATSYEPYTNGASPNPDYPQDIHTVSGDNTIFNTGKNLFSGYVKGIGINGTTGAQTSDLNSATSDFIPLKITEANKYKVWGLPTTISSFVAAYNSNKEFLGRTGGVTLGEFTLSPQFFVGGTPQGTGDIAYIRVTSYKISTSTGTVDDVDNAQVMLERGTTATTYEPYQGANYNVNLPVENVLDFDTILNYWGAVYTKENGTYTLTNRGEFYARPYTLNLEVGKTYTLSGVQVAQASSNLRLEVLKDNNIVAIQRFSPETTVSGKTFTVEEGHTYKIRGNYSTGGYPMIISKPQLEEGTKANTYTPYGTSPIELCKIGDYQDRFIRTSGKNLYDRENATENRALNWGTGAEFGETGSITSDFIKTTKGDKFTITFSSQIMFYDSNKEYLGCLQSGGETIAKTTGNTWKYFTTPNVDEIYYVKIGTRANADGGVDKLNANIMLNKGYAVIPYEPYGNGDWYLNKQIGKVVLDGSENWTYVNSSFRHSMTNLNTTGNDVIKQVANYFKAITYNSSWSSYDYFVCYTLDGNVVLKNKDITSINDFKTWLSTHNTIVYYVLATPTYTKIEGTLESQLNALSGAKSYNSQTNISQENNDNSSIMSAVALSE